MALVVLVGLPGSGKSTVARAVGRALGAEVVDTDDEFGPAGPGASFAALGEAAFREREVAALERALASPGVVATGGGAVVTTKGRAALLGQPVVWLRAEPAVLVGRLGGASRPVLGDDPASGLARLAGERTDLYAEVSRADVDAAQPLESVVAEVVRLVREWAP